MIVIGIKVAVCINERTRHRRRRRQQQQLAEACATSAHNQLIVFPVRHVLVRDIVLGRAVRAKNETK